MTGERPAPTPAAGHRRLSEGSCLGASTRRDGDISTAPHHLQIVPPAPLIEAVSAAWYSREPPSNCTTQLTQVGYCPRITSARPCRLPAIDGASPGASYRARLPIVRGAPSYRYIVPSRFAPLVISIVPPCIYPRVVLMIRVLNPLPVFVHSLSCRGCARV